MLLQVHDELIFEAPEVPTFAHHLRRLGYTTVMSGKMHFVGPDQLHGLEERLTTDIYPADFGWTPDWTRPGERIDWWYHNLSSVTGAGVAEITNQLEYDDEVAFLAKQRLYDFARQEDSQPFCMLVSFTHPHDPYVMRRKYWDLYDHDAIPMPAVPAIAYADQDPHSKRLLDASDWTRFDIREEHVRNARHAYFAAISYLDDRIGEILEVLRLCRLAENTIVLFCSDHGDMLGERGLWFKMSFHEGSARVPMIIHAPAHFAPRPVAAPTSLLDVLPTLVELAGGDVEAVPSPLDGQTLVPLASGASENRHVLAEYAAEGAIAPIIMVREGNYKFVRSLVDPDQLFDVVADPHEQTDIADDPAHAGIRKTLAAAADARWDLAAFNSDVLESQARRLVVYDRDGAYYMGFPAG
jgi:choline-sulfatase